VSVLTGFFSRSRAASIDATSTAARSSRTAVGLVELTWDWRNFSDRAVEAGGRIGAGPGGHRGTPVQLLGSVTPESPTLAPGLTSRSSCPAPGGSGGAGGGGGDDGGGGGTGTRDMGSTPAQESGMSVLDESLVGCRDAAPAEDDEGTFVKPAATA